MKFNSLADVLVHVDGLMAAHLSSVLLTALLWAWILYGRAA